MFIASKKKSAMASFVPNFVRVLDKFIVEFSRKISNKCDGNSDDGQRF